MIIQTTVTRDECFLIKSLLPVWKKYADGFVFMVDTRTTDDTREYLHANKEKYNILEVLEHDWETANPHETEAYGRQRMFDAAYKYSNKIISLDTDEYLDGTLSKQQLDSLLDTEKNTVFLLQWIQYTSKNEIRIDDAWVNNFKDRIGSYTCNAVFDKRPNHSFHVPFIQANLNDPAILAKHIDPSLLFIAHLTWLDKKHVGVKQYYWKVWDYVQHKLHGVNIIDCGDYDSSINNFIWKTTTFKYLLKVEEGIYKTQNIKENTKLKYVVEQTQKHNIPNLGDWSMGIYEYATKQKLNNNTFSICITTFRERQEIVKDLITSIRSFTEEHDIILLINGNNEEKMDETYRKDILSFCASIKNCYPIVCPEFKSLSKLWNTGIIFSNTEYNLVLNDDTKIENSKSFDIILNAILNNKEQLFTINGTFSHFVITKTVLHNLNYFDERLIAFGEEDGDLVHSYILKYKKPVPSIYIEKFNNTHAYNLTSKNLEIHTDNKPRFNRDFTKIKYKEDPKGICGMNPTPIKRIISDKQQYPYEQFVKNNKHNIKQFQQIVNEYD
jgi:hypothetical protein